MTGSIDLWDWDRFPERFALWKNQEQPPAEIAAIVEEWMPTRRLDPTRGARREREEDNYWLAQVPHAAYGGLVVVCSYWIVRTGPRRLVRCDLFGSLSWPV